jgi:hypothetical protein
MKTAWVCLVFGFLGGTIVGAAGGCVPVGATHTAAHQEAGSAVGDVGAGAEVHSVAISDGGAVMIAVGVCVAVLVVAGMLWRSHPVVKGGMGGDVRRVG